MKIISVVSRKGGAGKSTMVFGLVSAAIHRGLNFRIIDTDDNGTSREWADRANALNGGSLVRCKTLITADAIYDHIDALEAEGDLDLLIVDNAGAASHVFEASSAADLILVPLKLSGPDLEQTINTVEWFQELTTRLEDPSDAPKLRVIVNDIPLTLSKSQSAVLAAAQGMTFVGKLGLDVKLPLLDMPVKRADAYVTMGIQGPITEVIKRHNQNPGTLPMQRNPKPLLDALREMGALLDLCCDAIGEK